MARNEPRFRAAEERLWASVGVTPVEHRLRLASGGSVRVQETGAGAPVLFVHGGSNGGASWAPLIARLDEYRCIVLDRPGCGLSEAVRGGAGFGDIDAVESFADDLIRDVLDALELPRAHIATTSYGGYFGFRGAAAHPDRIDRMVEFGWPLGAPMATVPLAMRIAAVPGLGSVMARVPPTRASVRMLLRQIGLRGALESGRFDDVMLDWFLAVLRDTETLRNELRATPKVITPIRGLNERMLLAPELLARVAVPVLFFWGADDPNGGEAIARDFVACLPDARLEMIDAAGHAPWIDDPKRAATSTREFLAG